MAVQLAQAMGAAVVGAGRAPSASSACELGADSVELGGELADAFEQRPAASTS